MLRYNIIVVLITIFYTCTMRNILCSNIQKWHSFGASDTVIHWIQNGVKFPITEEIPSFEIANKTFSPKEEAFLNSELSNLLLLGCINVSDEKPRCVSPISCVPKQNGKLRLVTDLRHVNSFSNAPKIKYEDINTVIKVVQPNDNMVTADLQNGFFHVPVHRDHQTLLGFEFKSKYYTWSVLPFGHNCSPFYFVKLLRPVVTFLRSLGIRIVLYVDDFILFAQKDAIIRHRETFLSTLQELGWIINFEKSSLEPTITKEFIGYLIDNTGAKTVIKIPNSRITKLRKDITRCLNKGSVNARTLARIGGQCISMYKCIFPAKLQLRNLYRLLASKTSWTDILSLDKGTRDDLTWWQSSLTQWNGLIVQECPIDIQMTTDASSIAWGAWIPDHSAQGFWTKDMSYRSSNYRELSAVWLGLLSLRKFLQNKTIQICSDNVTTLAFINHMGAVAKS